MTQSTNNNETSSDRLGRKLGDYAGTIVQIAHALPDEPVARHVRDQLLRSGTAPGAHYSEARSAESHADFTHKIGLAAKEARESLYWLQVADGSGLLDFEIDDTPQHADRLVGWLYSSMRTAREHRDK